MFNQDMLTRQSDIIPQATLGLGIDIIGCGGLGSTTAVWLARMGCYNLRLWDFDTVAVENLSSQHFNQHHLGMNKAKAVSGQICEITDMHVVYQEIEYIDATLRQVVISAVDNMQTREDIYKQALHSGSQWLIDPRMGAEMGYIYVLDLYDAEARKSYEISLYPDEEALEEPCTGKATGYCALELTAKIVKVIKDIMVGHPPIKSWTCALKHNFQQTFLRTSDEQS